MTSIEPAPLDLLLELIQAEDKTSEEAQPTPLDVQGILQGVPEGQRDYTLFRYAASLRARNVRKEEALLLVKTAASNCSPPFPEREALAKVDSAYLYPEGTSLSRELARLVVEQAGTANPEQDERLNNLPMSDSGQAEAIVLLHGDKLRYDHSRGNWLLWDSPSWRPDKTNGVQGRARNVARARLTAAAREDDPNRRQALARWALRCENRAAMENALTLAASMEPVAVTSKDFDLDPFLLACGNGILDLHPGTLREGKPEDMLSLQTSVPYHPGATCPRWLRFLQEIFQDGELVSFIQRSVGYSLSGDTREQCLFLLHGTGANGKSVFLSILGELLGEYAAVTPFTTFLANRWSDNQTNDLAALRAVRLVSASEAREGVRLNESRIKAVTGGDKITARFLFQEHFTYKPTFKIWLAANSKPAIHEQNEAIWRRIRLIPFTRTFPPGQADPLLLEKLRGELPGILYWAVQGYLAWQCQGLGLPGKVREATAIYREESDLLGRFLEETATVQEGARCTAKDLYAAFKEWAMSNGEPILSGTSFGRRLSEKGFEKTHTYTGAVYYGLTLRYEK